MERLTRGCFVFEYGGEILTNKELLKRESGHKYSVALDAHWQSELALGDDKLLSLDASTYTNVARWLNHRYDLDFLASEFHTHDEVSSSHVHVCAISYSVTESSCAHAIADVVTQI